MTTIPSTTPRFNQTLAWGVLAASLAFSTPLRAQQQTDVRKKLAPSVTDMIFVDRLGEVTHPEEGEVHPRNIPADAHALKRQIPKIPTGSSLPSEVKSRIEDANEKKTGFEWFPGTPVKLQPYFKDTDQFGTTCLQPGALVSPDVVSAAAQSVKDELAKVGLTYTLPWGYNFFSLNHTLPGTPSQFSYINTDARFNWAIFNDYKDHTAGWITSEIVGWAGLTPNSRKTIPQDAAATIANTAGSIWGQYGIWLQQLAWQQSFFDGKFVVVAGQVDQSNYFDFNTYANNKNGQFLGSPFVNSQVLAMPCNNLGINLQWQPCESFYSTFGFSANNQLPGYSPFDHLNIEDTSYLLELGYVAKDFFGLGKGTYRLQPFVAVVGGITRPGICLNVEQKLGKETPFGYFGRFGYTDQNVAIGGASSQIATGLNMTGLLSKTGIVPKLKNDQLGIGLLWSQPAKSLQPTFRENEYGIDTFYSLQLTQTITLVPDFQVIWNPVNNPTISRLTQFTAQVNFTW